MLTPDYTEPAPLAFLGTNYRLHFFGIGDLFHFDGFKRAPFQTCLATFTTIFVYYGQEPVGLHKVESMAARDREKVLAGAIATIAIAPVDQPGFFCHPGRIQ
jgi:hypothetical protein